MASAPDLDTSTMPLLGVEKEKKRGFSFKSFFIAFRSSLPIHESKISMNSDTKAFQGDAYNGSEWVADDQAPLVTRKSMTRATTKTNTRDMKQTTSS
ncbi:hypothetical protein MPTK1_2g14810 [Marchantia polymorpha subsp. ruderalis]|uniref:Uncharacterized protein n=1 Tax=Marchantia polymorpha TaxID=3197 RepID=A0A2R6X1U0_MARPO|nr:hypothetical protein MARPO_0042s0103 [Marchantia polymorpha]BBN02374.1 hypothetical protein Mp_2g14810 [Marchantia polymorpha subsp. ruderalis]|eukprot:PTQ40069.1 hypothetical protein MARPO_0042s0103 [Marchantia polymorpha]